MKSSDADVLLRNGPLQHGCFTDAISLSPPKLVDLKPLITVTYPVTEATKASEAQRTRGDTKIVIMSQKCCQGSAWME